MASTALVPVSSDLCPACGQGLVEQIEETDALFRHAGYGATAQTIRAYCRECSWQMVRSQTEVRPPRRCRTRRAA